MDLWRKYSQLFPNGVKRTTFMAKIKNLRYKDDLGGLCPTCSDYGYSVFARILRHINSFTESATKKRDLISLAEAVRCHLKRGFEEELVVDFVGTITHDNCITHCLRHAFGICEDSHNLECEACSQLFQLSQQLRDFIPELEVNDIEARLLFWMSHQARKKYLAQQFNAALSLLDMNGAVILCDYKMKILKRTAREKKADWYGKRGFALHTILVITKQENNSKLQVRAFDHWSEDGKQNIFFTVSSFDVVLTQLRQEGIQWVRCFSDNGAHYHGSALMAIACKWYRWYSIEIRGWNFFEAGEAKSIVDTHHATLSQAITRYVRIGNDIIKGTDIEKATQNLKGTYIRHIKPDRSKQITVKTIKGISNWHYIEWPITGLYAGGFLAYELPGIGTPDFFDGKKLTQVLAKGKGKVPQKLQQPIPQLIGDSTTPHQIWEINPPEKLGSNDCYSAFLLHYVIHNFFV